MNKSYKISVSKLSTLFEFVEKFDISPNILLESVDLQPKIFDSPENVITLDQYNTLTKKAASLTNDEYFGLHQGELFKRFSNIISYTMMNCSTIGEAMEKFCKYQSVMDNGESFEMKIGEELATVEYTIPDIGKKLSRHLFEYRLATAISFAIYLSGIPSPVGILDEVWFRHDSPPDISEHHRIFQCPVLFNKSMNAFIFKKEHLDIPVMNANKELLEIFEKKTREALKRIDGDDTYSYKVSRILVKKIQGKIPCIEEIAKELSVSTRNLQLKLSEEETSYRDILNTVRKDMAIEYLKDNTLSIAEIAYLVGFSEPSVFNRSFKKWTNNTPGMYRKNMSQS